MPNLSFLLIVLLLSLTYVHVLIAERNKSPVAPKQGQSNSSKSYETNFNEVVSAVVSATGPG